MPGNRADSRSWNSGCSSTPRYWAFHGKRSLMTDVTGPVPGPYSSTSSPSLICLSEPTKARDKNRELGNTAPTDVGFFKKFEKKPRPSRTGRRFAAEASEGDADAAALGCCDGSKSSPCRLTINPSTRRQRRILCRHEPWPNIGGGNQRRRPCGP